MVDLTKGLREHATATRELIVALEHLERGLRGGYGRPDHWVPDLSLEHGFHADAWEI